MAKQLVRLSVRIPESVRDTDLKTLKQQVDPLVPAYLKKPSQDDLVAILIRRANAAALAKAVEAYYKFKNT
jgi:hypothetical protein